MKRQNKRNALESSDDNGDNNNNELDHKLHECKSITDHKVCNYNNDVDEDNNGCNGTCHVAK